MNDVRRVLFVHNAHYSYSHSPQGSGTPIVTRFGQQLRIRPEVISQCPEKTLAKYLLALTSQEKYSKVERTKNLIDKTDFF
jgi:hypothetical protein